MQRHQPKTILLDSVLASRARPNGISVRYEYQIHYIWHGYWEHIVYMDALGGDFRSNVLIDRVYTWGRQNEEWLKAIG